MKKHIHMSLLTLTLAAAFISNARSAENLVRNGDFLTGADSWHLQNLGGVTADMENLPSGTAPDGQGGAIKITTTEVEQGVEPWKLQLFQKGIALERDREYQLTFNARGTGLIQIVFREDEEPYAALDEVNSGRDVFLRPEWSEFSYIFTSSDDNQNVRLTFDSLAVPGLDAEIANVQLVPLR